MQNPETRLRLGMLLAATIRRELHPPDHSLLLPDVLPERDADATTSCRRIGICSKPEVMLGRKEEPLTSRDSLPGANLVTHRHLERSR